MTDPLYNRTSGCDEETNPLCDYTGPTKLGHCSHMQISGFFMRGTVQNLIQEVRSVYTKPVSAVNHLCFMIFLDYIKQLLILLARLNFCL
jgi:hypothetical protein